MCRVIIDGCFGMLLTGVSIIALAIPPEIRQPNAAANAPGGEFVPQTGYLRTVQLLCFRPQLQPAAMALAPGMDLSLSGTRMIPVVCVEFSNRPSQFPINDYQQNLFDPPGERPTPPRMTMTQYYRDISNGRFVPSGRVLGWYKLPK